MSLIHDALKSMDAPQDPQMAPARAPATAVHRRPAWLDAVLAFVLVAGAGMVGWFTWQSQAKPRADISPVAVAAVSAVPQPLTPPVPVAAPADAPPAEGVAARATPMAPLDVAAAPAAPVAPVVYAAPAAPHVPTAAHVSTAVPSTPAAPVVVPAPIVSAAATSAAVEAPPAAAPTIAQVAPRPVAQRPMRAARPVVQAAPASVVQPVVDDTPIELIFARFVAAMKEGRGADAERALGTLKERLPAGSLGRLRAQAWYDLSAGREAAAADGYRAIIERMPADEEAAINLASIQAHQKRPEEARATLDAAMRLQPDSAALRAALAQFTPAAR